MVQKIKNYSVYFIAAIFMFLSSCTNPSTPETKPIWLEAFIREQTDNHQAPVEIWMYKWNNKTVYYSIAGCFDCFNLLLDKNGKVLCSPNGGFSGQGDGKCPDFWKEKRNGKLIWKYKDS